MAETCPISNRTVDSYIIRLVALQVALVGILFLYTGNTYLALILLWDYSMRILRIRSLTPFLNIAILASSAANLRPKMCDEAPKRFALYMGFGLVVAIALALMLSFSFLANILMISLITFALMDAVFDYCVGCKIYQILGL